MISLLGVEVAPSLLAVVLLAALAGGVAQSTLGFGAAFTTVPALAFAAPELLPGSVLVAMLPLTIVMAIRAHRDADVRAVGRLTVGRLPGIVVGAAVVASLPIRALTFAVALLLLAAVTATASGWELPVTPRREVAAGFVSGITGTAAGLGGPPLALLYRGRRGAVLRPTLAMVWAVGLPPAIGSLAVAGEFTATHARSGLVLAAVMLVGLAIAVPIVRFVEDATIRSAVLGWAALGAVLSLGRALVA